MQSPRIDRQSMFAPLGLARLARLSLVRQVGLYATSNFISNAIPFILLPVMTRFLTPADVGTVAMFLLVAMFLDPLINVGLVGAVTVEYYDRTVDLAEYIGTGLLLIT